MAEFFPSVIGSFKEKSEREAQERRSLEIAEEALFTAKEANRIAIEELAAARLSADAALSSSESARLSAEAALASSKSATLQARWARWAAIIAMTAAIIEARDSIVQIISITP